MIITAYHLGPDGVATKDSSGQEIREHKDDGLYWLHLDGNNPALKPWLLERFDFLDEHIVEALYAEETRPRMAKYDKGAILILRGVNLQADSTPEDMISIRMWIDKKHIISVQKRQLKSVTDVEDRILAGKGPRNSGQFIALLASKLLEKMEPVLAELNDMADQIEEDMLETSSSELRENVVDLRKKSIILKRYLSPQRDAIGSLLTSNLDFLGERSTRSLHEAYNNVTRYVEDLDAVRERTQIVKDELSNNLAEKLNRNMYVLSVIAAIFLPISFLTGLLGVNIAGIPGVEEPLAFWIFSGLLAGLVVAQIGIFKLFKWL